MFTIFRKNSPKPKCLLTVFHTHLDRLVRRDGDNPRPQVEPELGDPVRQPQGYEVPLRQVVLGV